MGFSVRPLPQQKQASKPYAPPIPRALYLPFGRPAPKYAAPLFVIDTGSKSEYPFYAQCHAARAGFFGGPVKCCGPVCSVPLF